MIKTTNKNECFILFHNSKDNFKQTKKDFKTYKDAMKFMAETFDTVNSDFISYY
jgi:hypothetical protein|tara:strand:+ start:1561 stop:1722 length:162 start_codon:yes stop_codon:yes gene_type:complete